MKIRTTDNYLQTSIIFLYSSISPSKFRRNNILPLLQIRYLNLYASIQPAQTKFTGVGAQDVLLFSVVLAGFSTTISFTNLLITRRTLISPGLRNRRILIPFITISLLLTLRMLAIVTPILGAAVIMVLMDRH